MSINRHSKSELEQIHQTNTILLEVHNSKMGLGHLRCWMK